jgi:hypothetical protein
MFFKLYFKIKVGLILSKEAKRKGEKERSIVMLMRMVFFFFLMLMRNLDYLKG